MTKAAREQLSQFLNEHLNTIHETFQMLDQTPASSLEKLSWKEVIQMGEQVSKQATTVGMLCTGETPEVKGLEENMYAYFNFLQGLLLLSHGSSVGAGPTLSSCIHKSVKQVVDSSFILLREAVSSYGSPNKSQIKIIPQLVGNVWDSCSALKKTPSTNVTAIGRAITQIAVSIKDVLREIKELKAADEPSSSSEAPPTDGEDMSSDGSCDGDLGNDLSPEEIKIVHLSIKVVSELLVVIKELIRSITGLLNCDEGALLIDSLEKLLKNCRSIGVHVDELGASLYPPQEICVVKVALEKFFNFGNEMEMELRNVEGCTDEFGRACGDLRNSLEQMESELGFESRRNGLVPKMENLVLTS